MKLSVLGSSSAGNCYILHNAEEALVLEAGIRFDDVKKAVGFNISKVCACLISHEHGDHAGHAKEMSKYEIPIYASQGTLEAIGVVGHTAHAMAALKQYKVGRFTVMPFNVKHDAKEPFGFLVSHPETGVILFATDTYYLPNRFAGLNHILIECNYVEDVLRSNIEAGLVPHKVAVRVHESHMELQTCVDALRSNDLRSVNEIVLIHMSEGNGDECMMCRSVVQATGKTVYVAQKGLELSINKNIF